MGQLGGIDTYSSQNDPSPLGDHRHQFQQQQFWTDEDEEDRFAMRQLPPLPIKRQQQNINYYGRNF